MAEAWVISKVLRKKIVALEKERALIELRMKQIDEEIDDLTASESPIKVGDTIQWESRNKGGRIYKGKVVAIRTHWRDGYTYRCHILTKNGKVSGSANVDPENYPEKVFDTKKG